MDNLSFADVLVQFYKLELLSTSKFEYDLDDEHILLSEAFSISAISGLIGKEAKAKSKSFFFDGLKECIIYFETINSVNEIEIIISDSKGNIIFASKINSLESKFVWNGKDNLGHAAPAGEYFFKIFNPENNQEIQNCFSYIIGKINKMIFSKQGVCFNINNVLVPYDSVQEIRI